MNTRLVILGAGESGVGTAILGVQQGFDVFVSDMGIIKAHYLDELVSNGIEFEAGTHSEALILNADLVVKSPGIPDKAPLVKKLKEKGVPIYSEIEFASKYSRAKMICITGSNGKTTTTLLCYELLKTAGFNVGLAGNIGQSFARQVAQCDFDYYVLELSSFQLDNMYSFKADIAILMNITPDHLDRYNYDMQNYVDSKFRIVQNQTADDLFIYFADDQVIASELEKRVIPSKKIGFSVSANIEGEGACLQGETLKVIYKENSFEMSIYDLSLQGKHNAGNSMAAAIAGMASGIRNEQIRECMSSFKGVEHRLERYLTVHGIDFINDSKATNINSTWYALESMSSPTIWIVGGVDKGNDYTELYDLVKSKVKAIVCLGTDNQKIIDAFTGMVPEIVETQSMDHAVKSAYFLAETGDTVLLSPACASFDLFVNYEDRGQQFKESVRNL